MLNKYSSEIPILSRHIRIIVASHVKSAVDVHVKPKALHILASVSLMM